MNESMKLQMYKDKDKAIIFPSSLIFGVCLSVPLFFYLFSTILHRKTLSTNFHPNPSLPLSFLLSFLFTFFLCLFLSKEMSSTFVVPKTRKKLFMDELCDTRLLLSELPLIEKLRSSQTHQYNFIFSLLNWSRPLNALFKVVKH